MCLYRAYRHIRLTSPTLILDAVGNQFPFLTRRRAWSSFDMVVFNRCPRSPLVGALVSRTQHRTFAMASFDIPVILDISSCERPWHEIWTIISIVTGQILVSIIVSWGWDYYLQASTARGWMQSTQIGYTLIGTIGEVNTLEKKGWPGLDKNDGRP